jgi:transcriptional regulator with XRE-family HTH domain
VGQFADVLYCHQARRLVIVEWTPGHDIRPMLGEHRPGSLQHLPARNVTLDGLNQLGGDAGHGVRLLRETLSRFLNMRFTLLLIIPMIYGVNPRHPSPHRLWGMTTAIARPSGSSTVPVSERNIRVACGERLKALRKQKDLTQKEIAAQLGVHATQLNKYEMGMHAPPPDKLVFLAELFGVSVDYLLTGGATDTRPMHHHRLLERFRIAQEFASDDQEALIRLMDAMIAQYRSRRALDPVDQPRNTAT